MKSNLRKIILEKRDLLSPKEITRKSLEIKQRLFNLKEFNEVTIISFYVSFRSEVETHEMIKETLRLDKRVVVPIVKKKKRLSLSELKNFNELELGKFGILEPKVAFRREINLEEVELVIVPGVAFDEKGNRIGYGRGYYDDLLTRMKKIPFIGLAYELQIVPEIPKEERDIPVHKIITEDRIIRCKEV